jgi:hypothetical protein
MATDKCIEVINKAFGGEMPEEKMIQMITDLRESQRYLLAKGIVSNTRDAAILAAEKYANNEKLAAVIERRNQANNLIKRIDKVEWVKKHFSHNMAEGVEAILVGTNRAVEGAKDGVAQAQAYLRDKYLSSFTHDLEASGHLKIFNSGVMDDEIAEALSLMDSKDPASIKRLSELPKEAKEIAEIVRKAQEASRIAANDAGAWIGKIDGYITKQTHNAEKIMAAGKDMWSKDMAAWLDFDRIEITGESTTPASMLDELFLRLSTGDHSDPIGLDTMATATGQPGLVKKMSASRKLIFKDAASWMEYNKKYGNNSLRESIVKNLEGIANKTAIIEKVGTNLDSFMKTVRSDLLEHAKRTDNLEQFELYKSREKKLDRYVSGIDGTMNATNHPTFARRMANFRSVETMAKLGGMILSQLADIGVYGSAASYHGRTYLSGMHEAISGLGRNLSSENTKRLASALNVVMDNMTGEMTRIGSFDENGSWSKATSLFMKLGLGQQWAERMKISAGFGMAHHMSGEAHLPWGSLDKDYQRVLSQYNINETKWDVIRSISEQAEDGKHYITPDNIKYADESLIANHLKANKTEVKPQTIAEAKKEIEQNLATFYKNESSIMALEPSLKNRVDMVQGTQAGSAVGEGMRTMMQFKSFTIAFMQRILGRELYGRGYMGDDIIGALRHGNGEWQGIAKVIATTTAFGYMSYNLKQLARGKTPADPTQDAATAARLFMVSLVQGGGAGIYGDLILGSGRMSGSVEAFAGPGFSALGKTIDLLQKARVDAADGNFKAANLFNHAIGNTPFINLFWIRPIMDYLVLNRIQESLSPGYLQRLEANNTKMGQSYLFNKPSEHL